MSHSAWSIAKAPLRLARSVLKRTASAAKTAFQDAAAVLENLVHPDHGSPRLIILDDLFPNLISGFRVAEYVAYLRTFPFSEVHSQMRVLPWGRETMPRGTVLRQFREHYPDLISRVRRFNRRRTLKPLAFYTIFLDNAAYFLPTIEAYQVPFVFTLYPGGGFRLDDPASDEKLRRVFACRQLKRVIVTQKFLLEYVLKKGFAPREILQFIPGGVHPQEIAHAEKPVPVRYGLEKQTLDICFVANKYMPRGRDKGYDVFVEVAKRLADRCPDARFHVVGNFDARDIDVTSLGNRIQFYGLQLSEFFPGFYAQQDMILSPNAPFILDPGMVDGFPTGCCVEAGMAGTAVFCTDELNQNHSFDPGRDIEIISRDIDQICAKIQWYRDRPTELARLRQAGQAAFQKAYGEAAQLWPRIQILNQVIAQFEPTNPTSD